VAPIPAARIGDDEVVVAVLARRSAIDEEVRPLDRTSTTWPREALEPAASIADRKGRRRSKRRDHGADDRRTLFILDDALNRTGRD
jgi:hypothetical protein